MTAIVILHLGVSSARINPHPWRLPTPSTVLQPRQPIPLFEKSNVLVMYVPLSLKKAFSYSIQFCRIQWTDRLRCVIGMGSQPRLNLTLAGKTLLARTLAKVLDVPFSVSDATSFTQVSQEHGIDPIFRSSEIYIIGWVYVITLPGFGS